MSPSVRVGLLGLLVCLFAGLSLLGAGRYRAALRAEEAASLAAAPAVETAETPARPAEPETLVVHVAGSVSQPGVYRLESGARVGDAIAIAGGVLPEGFPHALNLAGLLRDGEKVYVPSQSEVAPSAAGQGASHQLRGSGTTGTTGAASSGSGRAPVRLNTATAEELDRLPYVTPKMAVAIVEYRRAHGPFKSVEELERVKGIGSATVERLRGNVQL